MPEEKCPGCGATADDGSVARLEAFGSIRYPCGTRLVTKTREVPPASPAGLPYTDHAGVHESKDCLRRQRDRLQAIVEKLPKTADGAPVVPGGSYWQFNPQRDEEPFEVVASAVTSLGGPVVEYQDVGSITYPGQFTFSTFDAAEAAEEQTDANDDEQ